MSTGKTYEELMIERNERAIAPNIFIGLGGQGCKMVAQLAKKAKEEHSPAKYLSFVAIDTDVNELRKIKMVANEVVTVQTSSRMTIGEYLEYDHNARNNWFPINDIILDKTPSEGAGQIRAISNLVAHNAIREGEFTAINDAIDALFPLSDDDYEQSVHVTIMGTLAGGTGSGLVLPVALYVKNYLETIRQQKSAVIRGFFILPDVMESVITNEVERKNQYSNAYASLREIDAFMRRPYDVDLQKRYPDLKVIIPKVGGDGYDEFNNAPFNFCFLFNKINNKGTSITNKDDLLMQAVECVYDMSISPICTKVNSQEDNIIREKISSGNRSSYAGAGASRLVYPYKDIVEYVALHWAKNSISQKWLEGDQYIIDQQKDRNEAMNSGSLVDAFDADASYIDFINTKSDSDPFYKAILSQCQYQEKGKIDLKDKSKLYIKDLSAYTESLRAKNSKRSVAETYKAECLLKTKQAVTEIEADGSEYKEKRAAKGNAINMAADELLKYQDAIVINTNMQIDQIAQSIITADFAKNAQNDVPVLEKYMLVNDDKFMHPNAARYFLLSVSKEIDRKIDEFTPLFEDVKKAVDERIKNLKIERQAADIYDESKLQQIIQEHSKKVPVEKSERIGNIETIINDLLVVEKKSKRKAGLLDDYCYYLINIKVLAKVKAYIENITEGFKELYNKISQDVKNIDKSIEQIEKKNSNCKKSDDDDERENPERSPIIYVCSSKKCLNSINKSCKNPIGTYDLPTDLTKSIFDKAKKYAVMKQDGTLSEEYGIDENSDSNAKAAGINAFFGDVFESVIMQFWKDSVVKHCNATLDIDVVTAIYKEALVDAGCAKPQDKDSYLKSIIEKAKNLAIPFIDPPRGVQKREIRASAMNPEIMEHLGSNKKYFQNECLKEFNAELSADVPIYQILFYHSLYNVSAKNLTKMLPPRRVLATNSSDKKTRGGMYFETYHDRIERIDPLDSKNTEISPHIQRNWQYINVLPELDPEYQKELEKDIAKAFVYAIISNKLGFRKHDLHGYNYCYELIDAQLRSPQLIVSNGTNCDQFYEVLDALTICPRYVSRLLEMYNSEIAFENNNKVDFKNTQFYKKYSRSFVIEEFSSEPIMNILYIPILYKASSGANYHEAWGEALIAAIFEMIDDMVHNFEREKSFDDIKCEYLISLLNDEFDKNLDKLVALGDDDPKAKRSNSWLKGMKNDSVTLRIYDEICDILESIDGKSAGKDQYAELVKEISMRRSVLAEL